MPLTRAGVIGAGTMGMGIAQWLACSGFGVTLRSGRPEALEAFVESVRRFYARRVKRGTIAPLRKRGTTAVHRRRPRVGLPPWRDDHGCPRSHA